MSKRGPLVDAIAGGIAATTCACVLEPVDSIKTQLQVRGGSVFSSERTPLRWSFSGLRATLTALVPNWALYFPIYQFSKKKFPVSVAGGLAGVTTSIITSPLWVIRTRLQSSREKSVISVAKKIVANEGIRALYRGLPASLVGVLHVTMQMPVYEWMMKQKWCPGVPVASGLSKLFAGVLTYPHEVIRARLQDNGSSPISNVNDKGKNSFSLARDTIRSEGITAFYRGIVPALLRSIPASIITWTTYESIAKALN